MSGYPKADIYAPRTLRDLVRHPGFGMPPRVDELEDTAQSVRRSEWANLMRGQSVGKKTNLLYQWVSPFDLPRSGPSPQPAAEMLFEIGGSDMDACQLQITLCNPLAIPASAAQIADLAESIGGKVHCTIACIAFNGYADNVRCRTQVLVALDRAGSFRRLGIFPIALNTGRGNMQAADGWRFPGTN